MNYRQPQAPAVGPATYNPPPPAGAVPVYPNVSYDTPPPAQVKVLCTNINRFVTNVQL